MFDCIARCRLTSQTTRSKLSLNLWRASPISTFLTSKVTLIVITRSVELVGCLLIVADNPFDLNQVIPVLLAVLLNNPKIKKGKTSSGRLTGLFHSISDISVLDEFVCVDRSDRARAIEWLTQRRDQACNDAMRIAQQQIQAEGSALASTRC